MAYTTLASILGSTSMSNLLNEGDIDNLIIYDEISTDMAPGAWVYHDVSTGKWIPLDADTAAHKLAGPGQVGIILFEPRVENGTWVTSNATDYDVTYHKNVPICVSGIVVGDIVDQNASLGTGTKVMASSTAESVTVFAKESTGVTGGTAIVSSAVGALAAKVADDDTKAIFALGAHMAKGAIWGGINE